MHRLCALMSAEVELDEIMQMPHSIFYVIMKWHTKYTRRIPAPAGTFRQQVISRTTTAQQTNLNHPGPRRVEPLQSSQGVAEFLMQGGNHARQPEPSDGDGKFPPGEGGRISVAAKSTLGINLITSHNYSCYNSHVEVAGSYLHNVF